MTGFHETDNSATTWGTKKHHVEVCMVFFAHADWL